MKRESFALVTRVATALLALGFSYSPALAADGDEVFATVSGEEITRAEFEREVYSAARETYYHGRPPESEEFIEFRKDVADRMIERRLLLTEAARREIQPDTESIDAKIAAYEARYGETDRWKTEGPKMIAALRARFEEDSLLETLEARVRSVSVPDEPAAKAFYDGNPQLFTEPERERVSLILLAVPPSSTGEVWTAVREEASRIMDELATGTSFEELARQHSSDRSAADGGDMGYLHSGMLAEDAEEAIDALKVGDISEPVQVLEGIAIFKLTDRTPPRLRGYEDVKGRASDLLAKQQGDRAWEALLAQLRAESEISVDSEYLVTVPAYME